MQPNEIDPAIDPRDLPATMRAMVQDRFGGPEVLAERTMPVPQPGPDQILIEVKAASLNPYDWHMIRGLPYLARMAAGIRRPKHPVPGADMAGVVVAVGSDADASIFSCHMSRSATIAAARL